MQKIFRVIFIALIAAIPVTSFLNSCTAPCNYPDQRGVVVRIVNAMPDMPMITVFINGKVFVQNYTYNPPVTDLYLTSYPDGSPISAGDSTLFVVTSDAQGADTVAKGKVLLNFNRQTIIVAGRGHIKAPMKKTSTIMRLDDQADQPDPNKTLVRFINAVPDLDSLDIYFKGDTVANLGSPDLTIRYGKVNPHIALSSGTGLTITEAGHPEHVIFTSIYPFAFQGFFITVIVRGESKPLGTDFITGPLVLSDVVPGVYLSIFNTFGVRLVNATRSQTLSLLIRSTFISPENTKEPRGNYPNQETVFNIAPDSISGYLPLLINLDSSATFWFATKPDSKDTLSGVASTDKAKANFRFSKIAVEEDPLNPPSTPVYSYLNLPDTMTNPSGNFGRVRMINLSPDHKSIDVTINGKTTTITWKEVKFFDVALSDISMKLQDGAVSKSYTIPVSPIEPISVYILPDSSSGAILPIATSPD